MSILPSSTNEQIQFCETHVPVWKTSPTTKGLTVALVDQLEVLTQDARTSYNKAQSARDASKAATISLNKDASEMRVFVADLIRQIKAYAELQPNPAAVFAEAQLPLPASPTPLPAPGRPTDFSVVLNSDGSITLSWNSADSAASTGAFFMVSRKLPGQGGFTGIGGAPGSTSESRRASFTDATVPASAAGAGAQYIVQGFRGTRMGDASDAVIVQFGTDTGGGLNASLKMAA